MVCLWDKKKQKKKRLIEFKTYFHTCRGSLLFSGETNAIIISAQLSSVETRRNLTECNPGSLTINCASSVIAIDSIIFKYSDACDSICCEFSDDHCSGIVEDSDRNNVRRDCSGKSSCTVDLSGVRNFCALGINEPSYVTIYYYCIPCT